MEQQYLGVDVGGTHIAAGVITADHKLVVKKGIATPRGASGAALSEVIAALCTEVCALFGQPVQSMEAVGLGLPGYVDVQQGSIRFAANLQLRDEPIGPMLSERLERPVFLCNDANAAAYCEAVAGAARGAQSSVTLTIGTGIGGGMVLGDPARTAYFPAFEVGHMVIESHGRRCACGKQGCFETYASARALNTQVRSAMTKHPESMLWQLAGRKNRATGRTAFEAAAKGDPTAVQVLDRYLDYLACGVSNLINLLEPQVICIGGGISAQGEALLAPLREKVRKRTYLPQMADAVSMVAATWQNDAGILGAGLWARANATKK